MAGQRSGWCCALAVAVAMLCVAVSGDKDVAAMEEECRVMFPKVMACLDFATGSAAAPRPQCCEEVTEIMASSPECMCLVIQETDNTSDPIRSLGMHTDKLLHLPTLCQLVNTSTITDCPGLLGLAANSTEALIFSISTATPSPTGETSGANNLRPRSPSGVVVLFLGVFQVVLGFASGQIG